MSSNISGHSELFELLDESELSGSMSLKSVLLVGSPISVGVDASDSDVCNVVEVGGVALMSVFLRGGVIPVSLD